MNTLEILDRLVAFPTVSCDPNRELIAFANNFLVARGFATEIIASADGRKANLFASVGPTDRPGILLSGHTDVVPADGQTWSGDPFRLRIDNGRAFGRGTADMKGFLAAALHLGERAAGRSLSMPIQLALSYDEEVGCVGVRSLIKYLESSLVRPLMCIVGEPTFMRIATGHKGKLAARAMCCGVECHSAFAPRALNAIHLACEFVRVLRIQQDRLAKEGVRDTDYEVPYTTLHAGLIRGGTALNIVPDRCSVEFEVRHVAQEDPLQILVRLIRAANKIVARRKAEFDSADIRVDVVNSYPGLHTPPDSSVIEFARLLVDDRSTFKVAFGTEGGLFDSHLSTPTVVCGPGSMDQGHKPNEYVGLEQLVLCDLMMDRLLDQVSSDRGI